MAAVLSRCLPDTWCLFAFHAFGRLRSVDLQPVVRPCSLLPHCRIAITGDSSLFLHRLILALTSVSSLKCISLDPFTTSLPKICDLITPLLLFFWAVIKVCWYNLTSPVPCLPIRSVILGGRDTSPAHRRHLENAVNDWGISQSLLAFGGQGPGGMTYVL